MPIRLLALVRIHHNAAVVLGWLGFGRNRGAAAADVCFVGINYYAVRTWSWRGIWGWIWARRRLGIGRVCCAPIVVAMVLAVVAAIALAAAIAD